MWIAVLGTAPWLILIGVLAFGVRPPRELPGSAGALADSGGPPASALPTVRIVVPARNEARNIEACVGSLAAQRYEGFGIVVVDDRSTDRTGELAAGVPSGHADGIHVVAGEELPEGWFGKPWACWQGVRDATEDLLLFTDADTRHSPDLLARAVEALAEDRADAVSLLGRQELGSFWERLLQPQVFTLLALRYPRTTRPLDASDAQDAIANGQYILVKRSAYEAIGGHHAVRHEVVEDLRLAQLLTGGGHRLSLRSAEEAFSTRMYQSFEEIVEGWTKNFSVGARQSAGWWGVAALPGIVAFQLFAWVLPPLVLLFVLFSVWVDPGAELVRPFLNWSDGALWPGVAFWSGVTVWSGATVTAGLVAWAAVYRQFEVALGYAALFPLGAALVAWIAFRSGLRGRRKIEWKGRRYSAGGASSPPD